MSFLLKQLGTNFKILAQNKEAALAAIKKMPGMEKDRDLDPKNHFSWVDTVKDKTDGEVGFRYCFMDSKTLEVAFLEWNWLPVPDPKGNIASLTFLGEKEGDYDLLFRQIAPWVESGSYIEMINEEGSLYCFEFNDGVMKAVKVRKVSCSKLFVNSFWRGSPVKTASFQHAKSVGWRVFKARTGRKGVEFTKVEINAQTNVLQRNFDVLVFAPKDDAIYIYLVELDDMPMLNYVGKI